MISEGYCWTRTGERQATRLRATYLKAVLRQDLGYFDLQTNGISEVITSISNDSLLIQDVISEKVISYKKKKYWFVNLLQTLFNFPITLIINNLKKFDQTGAELFGQNLHVRKWLCGSVFIIMANGYGGTPFSIAYNSSWLVMWKFFNGHSKEN